MSKELFMVSYDGKKVVMETKLKCASFDGDRKCLCVGSTDEINNSINFLEFNLDISCPHLNSVIHTEIEYGDEYKLISISQDKFGNVTYDFLKMNEEGDELISISTNIEPDFFLITKTFNIKNKW